MMNFFRRNTRIIFIVTIIAFLGGSFLSTVSYFLSSKTDYAIKVNGSKIPINLYKSIYINLINIYQQKTNSQLTENNLNELKIKIIQDLIQNEIFYQQSKIYGITVSNNELKKALQDSTIFKNNECFNKNKYIAFLTSIQIRPKEYESLVKKQIAGNKLKTLLASSVKIWNYEIVQTVKQNEPITKISLIQKKIILILNEWYINIIKNSKVTTSKSVLK
ncbi:MAG: SurA N-terminal domain-containing protein [Endomicrobium sp.]|nr:SurA N-terminal domain-containing protein [Endomicrobium sp.]